MKRYILPVFLILGFAFSLAFAQSITRSIQLSQDPSGPIGVDTNNGVYFPGHMNTTGTTPTVTACSTTPAIVGTDTAGKVTGGTGPLVATCTVTFARAYVTTPYCIVQVQNPATSPLAYSASTTAITITSGMGSAIFNYMCWSLS